MHYCMHDVEYLTRLNKADFFFCKKLLFMKLSARKGSTSSVFRSLHLVPLRDRGATQVLIWWNSKSKIVIRVFHCTLLRQLCQSAQIKMADFHVWQRRWRFYVYQLIIQNNAKDVVSDLFKKSMEEDSNGDNVALQLLQVGEM